MAPAIWMISDSQSQLSKLQKLQNAAARIVTLSPKRTHITPILQSLHWLPIKDRIVFKILLLIFHCVQGSAPQYNISLVHPYIPARNLRSSTSRALIIPKSTKTWGQRAFAHAGPYLWNSLPEDIKNCKSSESFKNHLKTYLFTHCYFCNYMYIVVYKLFVVFFIIYCALSTLQSGFGAL